MSGNPSRMKTINSKLSEFKTKGDPHEITWSSTVGQEIGEEVGVAKLSKSPLKGS